MLLSFDTRLCHRTTSWTDLYHTVQIRSLHGISKHRINRVHYCHFCVQHHPRLRIAIGNSVHAFSDVPQAVVAVVGSSDRTGRSCNAVYIATLVSLAVFLATHRMFGGLVYIPFKDPNYWTLIRAILTDAKTVPHLAQMMLSQGAVFRYIIWPAFLTSIWLWLYAGS